MNILHILQNSLPYISGSTIRSKYIFKYQKKFANVFVFTTFFFKADKNMEIIDNIPYFRMNKRLSPLLRFYTKYFLKVRALIFRFFSIDITNKILELPISFFIKSHIRTIVKTYKIDVIHQHSQSFIAKYSLEIAKKLDVPFVYEVRGFAEKSMLGNIKGWRTPNKKIIEFMFNKVKTRETNVLKKSDYVVTLSEPMRNILVNNRKVNKDKIIVVPNSIDEDLLKPIKNEYGLKKKILLDNCLVLGYFGRLRWYEGIETLLEALRILLGKGINVKLIIVGGSEDDYLNYLKREVINKNISNNVSFLGHVPHTEIEKYYSITDIIVIPRNNISVCRIVTPLKPIDAMSFKTLVMASDLPALRYTITPYKTGILFKPEDPVDLANKILEYTLNPESYQKIIRNAYNNVLKNFTWKTTVPKYKEIYEKLIEGAVRPRSSRMTKIIEKYKDWNEAFQMKKKYSKNDPFCYYDLAKKYLPEDENAVIIDLGCGTCRFEDYLDLWDKYENLIILDGNPITLNELRQKHNNPTTLTYRAPDRIPLTDDSVDYIFCGHLIEHLYFEHLYKLFKEFDRVLKNEGILVVSTPMMWLGFYGNFDHVKPYHPSVFEVYFCGLKSGDASYELVSRNYKIEDLVYRYFTHVDIHNRVGSSVKVFDFIIQAFRYVSRAFGIKRYKRSGYTIILRKYDAKIYG